ncbi:MAG: hypothetical protein ACMG51_00660, partial [Ginsengibacter sp.]
MHNKNEQLAADITDSTFPPPVLSKNDRKAKTLIWIVSIVVFIAIAFLSQTKLNVHLGFDPHLFATVNAIINSTVAILLLLALWAVKNKKFILHKKLM